MKQCDEDTKTVRNTRKGFTSGREVLRMKPKSRPEAKVQNSAANNGQSNTKIPEVSMSQSTARAHERISIPSLPFWHLSQACAILHLRVDPYKHHNNVSSASP